MSSVRSGHTCCFAPLSLSFLSQDKLDTADLMLSSQMTRPFGKDGPQTVASQQCHYLVTSQDDGVLLLKMYLNTV